MAQTKRYKVHKKYSLSDGTPVVGVTTVCNLLSKPQLISWANNLGKDGIDYRRYLDSTADVGTLAHMLIEYYLKGEEPNLRAWSQDEVDQATVCLDKFKVWQKKNGIKLIKSELSLVSYKYRYGGTCDLYAEWQGYKTLFDIKTSKGVYDSHFTQVSAYRQLLREHNYTVDRVYILRVSRMNDEPLEARVIPKIDLHFKRFLNLLEQYHLNKELNVY